MTKRTTRSEPSIFLFISIRGHEAPRVHSPSTYLFYDTCPSSPPKESIGPEQNFRNTIPRQFFFSLFNDVLDSSAHSFTGYSPIFPDDFFLVWEVVPFFVNLLFFRPINVSFSSSPYNSSTTQHWVVSVLEPATALSLHFYLNCSLPPSQQIAFYIMYVSRSFLKILASSLRPGHAFFFPSVLPLYLWCTSPSPGPLEIRFFWFKDPPLVFCFYCLWWLPCRRHLIRFFFPDRLSAMFCRSLPFFPPR